MWAGMRELFCRAFTRSWLCLRYRHLMHGPYDPTVRLLAHREDEGSVRGDGDLLSNLLGDHRRDECPHQRRPAPVSLDGRPLSVGTRAHRHYPRCLYPVRRVLCLQLRALRFSHTRVQHPLCDVRPCNHKARLGDRRDDSHRWRRPGHLSRPDLQPSTPARIQKGTDGSRRARRVCASRLGSLPGLGATATLG